MALCSNEGKLGVESRHLLDAMGCGFVVVRRDGIITDVNAVFLKQHRLKEDQVLRRPCYEVMRGMARPCPANGCYMDEAVRTRECVHGEHAHRIGDMFKQFDITFVPLMPVRGKVDFFLEITRPVLRDAVKSALFDLARGTAQRTGDEFFSQLVAHLAGVLSADYVYVAVPVDRTWKRVRALTLFADGRLAENMEYELDGSPCDNGVRRNLSLYPDRVQEIFPADKLLVEMGIRGYIGTPLKDRNGKVLGILVALFRQPIQHMELAESVFSLASDRAAAELERQNAHRQVRSERDRTQTYLDLVQVMIVALDSEGRITLMNRKGSAILGWSEDELSGRDWFSTCIPESVSGQVRSVFEKMMKGEHAPVEYYENPVRTKSGEIRILAFHNAMLKDAEGRIVGTLSAGEDVTDQRKAAEEAALARERLLQTDKLVSLGVLVSGVAHEINNPANVITLNGPTVKDIWEAARPLLEEYHKREGDFMLAGLRYAEACEQMPALIAGITESGERIRSIVEDLKSYARSSPADLVQTVDINAVVRAAIGLLSSQIRRATGNFTAVYGENLPPVRGNAQRLQQVVVNLVQNSCAALPARDRALTVATAFDPDAGVVRVEVIDAGVGMTEDDLRHATDLFFTTRRESGGTGLGLSVSLGIVREHGGSLDLHSKPGEGARAVVTLPALKLSSEEQSSGDQDS